MCTLNKLKKKLDFNKLIQFLNKYPSIIFYHSNSGNRRKLGELHELGKVLFLVNSARIRDLTKEHPDQKDPLTGRKVSHSLKAALCKVVKPSGVRAGDTAGRKVSKETRKPFSDDKHDGRGLTLLASAGAMGSTFLVGCKSLQDMQKVMVDNQPKTGNEKNVDLVCLGAIYNGTTWADHLDCLRLSQMDSRIKSAQEKLPRTLGSAQRELLNLPKKTINSLYFCLVAASKNDKNK